MWCEGENRQISFAEEFLIIYVEILPSRGWIAQLPTLRLGWAWWCPSKGNTWKLGEQTNFVVQRPHQHCLPGIRTNVSHDQSCWFCPPYGVLKMVLTSVVFLPRDPRLIMGKHLSIPSWGIFYKISSPCSSKLPSSSRNRKAWEPLRAPRSIKWPGDKYNVFPWMGHWLRRSLGKKQRGS